MHKQNIFIFGPESFVTTLSELKPFIKFNFKFFPKNLQNNFQESSDGIICHEDYLEDKINKQTIDSMNCLKILATEKNPKNLNDFDYILELPTSIKEINNILESSFAKKKFNNNSSIKINSYFLDKNEKKLIKEKNFVILTEKEIQLLELFLSNKKPKTKNEILSLVWNYSSDADTHTVETHIYRLRKKILDKFSDEKFILNNKQGYYI